MLTAAPGEDAAVFSLVAHSGSLERLIDTRRGPRRPLSPTDMDLSRPRFRQRLQSAPGNLHAACCQEQGWVNDYWEDVYGHPPLGANSIQHPSASISRKVSTNSARSAKATLN